LFDAALEQSDWIDDKVGDQFPRVRNKSGCPSGTDSGANHGDANRGKKRGFSKSSGTDLEQLSAKRQRGAKH
jgi:hypothetical protein